MVGGVENNLKKLFRSVAMRRLWDPEVDVGEFFYPF
jgi:hypothetical protein